MMVTMLLIWLISNTQFFFFERPLIPRLGLFWFTFVLIMAHNGYVNKMYILTEHLFGNMK